MELDEFQFREFALVELSLEEWIPLKRRFLGDDAIRTKIAALILSELKNPSDACHLLAFHDEVDDVIRTANARISDILANARNPSREVDQRTDRPGTTGEDR